MNRTDFLNPILQWIPSETINRIAIKSKSIVTIGLIAAASFGSLLLAFQTGKGWILTTATVSILTVGCMHKFLQQANRPFIRTALSLSLIITGGLWLGGSISFSYSCWLAFFSFISKINAEQVLFISFIATSLKGYGIPLGVLFLRKGYEIINNQATIEKLEQLAEHFRNIPIKFTQGFLQFWKDRLCLLMGLFLEHEALFAFIERLKPSSDIAMYLTAVLSKGTGIQKFKKILLQMELIAQALPGIDLNPFNRLYPFLKMCLSQIEEKDFNEMVDFLINHLPNITPKLLSYDHFKDLLNPKIINRINTQAYEYTRRLDQINQPDYTASIETLLNSLRQLELDMQAEPERDFKDRLEQINHKFLQKKDEIEALNRNKRIWSSLLKMRNPYLGHIKDICPNIILLIEFLEYSPDLIEKLNRYHQAALGFNPNEMEGLSGIVNLLRRIKSRLAAKQGELNAEPTPAWMFLGENRCGFIQQDFEELREIVNAKDLTEIENRFDALGLKTEEDLYIKNIVPRQGPIQKAEIKNRLKSYVQEQTQTVHLRTRIYQILTYLRKTETISHLRFLSEKVAALIYRLATMGMILIPIFIYPLASTIGFGAGLMYFTLKRFRFSIAERVDFFFVRFQHLGVVREGIAGRNFFSLTPNTRRNIRIFSQADFFARMRILNLELLITSVVAYVDVLHEGRVHRPIGLGGFLQGIALSQEVVNFFPAA